MRITRALILVFITALAAPADAAETYIEVPKSKCFSLQSLEASLSIT